MPEVLFILNILFVTLPASCFIMIARLEPCRELFASYSSTENKSASLGSYHVQVVETHAPHIEDGPRCIIRVVRKLSAFKHKCCVILGILSNSFKFEHPAVVVSSVLDRNARGCICGTILYYELGSNPTDILREWCMSQTEYTRCLTVVS